MLWDSSSYCAKGCGYLVLQTKVLLGHVSLPAYTLVLTGKGGNPDFGFVNSW